MARQGEYGSMSPACDMTYHGKRGCTACEAVRSARPKTQRKGAAPAEEAFATGKIVPEFKAGDTVTVAYRIVEGNKERVQLYRGVVIKISGHGDKRRFTVRKMSGTVGVERIFPVESPNIDSITVNKVGKVRRAKLYYLRNLTGKKARIAEKRVASQKEA